METSPARFTDGYGHLDLADLYHDEVRRFELLTPEEERELSKRVMKGDEKAVERLVLSNLRFGITYAYKYVRDYPDCGLQPADLIQLTSVGLINAARRFDTDNHPVRFISYAVWWIRAAILEDVAEHGRAARIPTNRAADLSRIGRFSSRFTKANGRKPTLDEIVGATGIPAREAAKVMNFARPALSLEATGRNSKGETNSLGEILPDEGCLDAELYLVAREESEFLCRNIRGVLKVAGELGRGERRRRTSVLYYGLDGSFEGRTLDYIGLEFDVTREMIRQVKEDTWVRLRGCGLAFGEDEFVSKLQSLQILENLVGETANFLEGPVEYSWFNVTTPEIQGERLGKRRREQERIQAMIK